MLEEEPAENPTLAAPKVKVSQPGFSWESLEEGAAGLLTAAYVLVVQDLVSLKNEVPWASAEDVADIQPPAAPLPAQQVKQILRQAKDELSELHRLLSA